MSALTAFRKGMTRRRTTLRVEELENRTVPTLLGQQLYPSDNAWNQKITDAPVASNSAAILNNIITRYSDGRLHPTSARTSTTPETSTASPTTSSTATARPRSAW
jgi:hypothetical protein